MAKSKNFLVSVFLLLCLASTSLGNDCLINKLDRQLGVRETGGNNYGYKVGIYLQSVGLGEGYSWCAAYVHWCLQQCGIETPITAWSPTAFNQKNVVYLQGKFYKEVEPGDVFVIYSMSKKRIAHTGFVRARINSRVFKSNEGNASREGAVNPYDGDGVYEKFRSYHMIYGISRWN